MAGRSPGSDGAAAEPFPLEAMKTEPIEALPGDHWSRRPSGAEQKKAQPIGWAKSRDTFGLEINWSGNPAAFKVTRH